MHCEKIDYEIFGNDMQVVEVELDPGETVIAEAGAMNWMDQHISFESKMGDGSQADEGLMGKFFSAGKRVITGESLFMTHFSNDGRNKERVAFAAPYPGSSKGEGSVLGRLGGLLDGDKYAQAISYHDARKPDLFYCRWGFCARGRSASHA